MAFEAIIKPDGMANAEFLEMVKQRQLLNAGDDLCEAVQWLLDGNNIIRRIAANQRVTVWTELRG